MPHTLEIIDNKLYAYGDNAFGQLGAGHNKKTLDKILVLTNTASDDIPWIKASAGRFHSAALKADGSLWVWGDNRFSQLAQDPSIQFSNKPIRLANAPVYEDNSQTNLLTGYYFTILYQYFNKAYGFGEFQNINNAFVEQTRTIVELISNSGNEWVSVETGPKTIVALHVYDGYKFSDWSGELFSKNYIRFEALKLGDIFTLYDPGNRNRALYKKVNTFSKGRGCCKVNALCLHRMYRELVSQIPPGVLIFENNISVFDILDEEVRDSFLEPILAVKEKYGVDFAFKSAIAKQSAMTKYTGYDPWTLNALFTITGTTNTLDLMLYDSLYFSDDLEEPFNRQTLVEKISAKEVFEPYSDVDLPPYLLEKNDYEVKYSNYVLGQDENLSQLKDQYFNTTEGMNQRKVFSIPFSSTSKVGRDFYTEYPYLYKRNTVTQQVMRYTFTSRYGFGYPLYRGVEGRLTNFDTGNPEDIFYHPRKRPGSGLPGCPYIGPPKYIRELETEDSLYDHEISTHIVNLPIDETGQIISAKHILNSPYLIRYAMEQSGKAFQQAFMDPTRRITTKYDGNINSVVQNPGNDPMMFYTAIPDPNYTGIAASPPTITVFYIGTLVKNLIEILIADETSVSEAQNYFGISKVTLTVMWNTVQNATYPYKQTEKDAFAKLSSLFYNKLKNQPIIDESANEIFQTGVDTITTDQFLNYSTLQKGCTITRRGTFCSLSEGYINMPYLGAPCLTDRTDRTKLYIFGNYIDQFKLGKTLIRYETWTGDDKVTKAGNPVLTFTPQGGIIVAKDAYQEHVATVDVLFSSFDASEYRTEVQLRLPFLANYLVGNLLYGNSMQYHAMPFIYFNSIASITEKLQNIPALLR